MSKLLSKHKKNYKMLPIQKCLQNIIKSDEFVTKITLITNTRQYASKKSKKHTKIKEKPRECGMEPCNEPKRSIWNLFCGKNKRKTAKIQEKPSGSAKPISDDQLLRDLCEISKMKGNVYKTCGEAYILQKDKIEPSEIKMDPEKKILDEMVKDPTLKGQVDPMPPFESVEKRLIELSQRKLHPLYKYLMSIPKKDPQKLGLVTTPYKTRSGAISAEEIPDHLGINKEIYDKKNITCEFKRIEPPQPLLAQIVEMAQNRKPTMASSRSGDEKGNRSQKKKSGDADTKRH